MSTVIIGAGIIGTSTAYFLSETSKSPESIHLVDSSPELFASASGYAAGFLARDWFSSSVSSLGELSFDLHKQLAEKYNGYENWGYSRSTGTSLADTGGKSGDIWFLEGGSRAQAAGKHQFYSGDGPAWLTRRDGEKLDVISQGTSTAQVDPLRLCQFLISSCRAKGVQVHHPSQVISVSRDQSGSLESVRVATQSSVSQKSIPCARLVIAAGPWTPRVYSYLFPASTIKIPITSLAGHSLLLRSPLWTSFDKTTEEYSPPGCHAVFTTDETGYSPEVFSRVGGEIYIAGLNSTTIPLPDLATSKKVEPQAIAALQKTAERLMGDELEVLREGLCFRPVTNRGTPIVGPVPGEKGVWIAAGHGPWGISLSLGTGKCVAEMVEGRETSAKLNRLGL